jgi:cellulose synthase/poly-beta-1,6-N-acetylglucosamine synthase-like glycosyltransferase
LVKLTISDRQSPMTNYQSPITNHQLPDVSVVVPIKDEVESLTLLLEAISSTLIANELTYEIICVDDGSSDG